MKNVVFEEKTFSKLGKQGKEKVREKMAQPAPHWNTVDGRV